MTKGQLMAAGACALVAAGSIAATGRAQDAPAQTVRYTMDASTATGPMAMMSGGVAHELELKLGSPRAPSAAPKADHHMPAVALLGPSVPLDTPAAQASRPRVQPATASGWSQPKGRIKIYWGCGEHAGPGQPTVIDFSKPGAVKASPFAMAIAAQPGPSAGDSRTFGEWPNARGARTVKAAASLVGQHRVTGNYTPDIAFTLSQDFMPALNVTAGAAADGSMPLQWNAVAAATGYYAYAMGSEKATGDMVPWSSAERAGSAGPGMNDWLAPATVAKLVAQKTVMPPSQTRCVVPAEVKKAVGEAMPVFVTGYGPEQDFAYPPKPAGAAAAAWRPEWTARARFRSTAMVVPGMPAMPQMPAVGGSPMAQAAEGAVPAKPCKPNVGGMLRGFLGGGVKAAAASAAGSAAGAALACKR